MKSFLASIFILLCSFSSDSAWQTDFLQAQKKAQTEHKYILLNFSGSDWCGPCMRMKKEIFSSKDFIDFSERNLVLINADFPRLKKNQLNKAQQKANDELAERYNQTGVFPCTLLLDANGKVIKVWDGFQKQGAALFTSEINQLIGAAK
ncbi:MAG: thioredoxin fold domain-containing protein [Chitinophagaceae bacterium]|jgi:thioredoxin-related protein